jgi:hypothetical protein
MDEETLTVWLDTALLMLGGFILTTVVLMTAVNPPAQSAESAGEQRPGNVMVEARWRDGLAADIDLWVVAPGDKPVGYSNANGDVFNLLRDDRGMDYDATNINYEVAYSRGMPAGEYIANVHLYESIMEEFPIEVTVVASVKGQDDDSARQLVSTTVKLSHENHQLTAFRFRLDDQGSLVPGSVNSIYRELRTKKKAE